MTTSPEKTNPPPFDGGATAMPIDPAQHPALAKQRRTIAPVGVIAALAVGALVGGVSGAGIVPGRLQRTAAHRR